MAEQVYLLLGSNEGEREAFLWAAADTLVMAAASRAVRYSSIYETAAWGIKEQPPFLNMAIGFETDSTPGELLRLIRAIESKHGRQRTVVWGQRTLDIDILLFGKRIIQTPELQVPHPRLEERRFALAPLAEIGADIVHPISGKTVGQLLAECPDLLDVQKNL